MLTSNRNDFHELNIHEKNLDADAKIVFKFLIILHQQLIVINEFSSKNVVEKWRFYQINSKLTESIKKLNALIDSKKIDQSVFLFELLNYFTKISEQNTQPLNKIFSLLTDQLVDCMNRINYSPIFFGSLKDKVEFKNIFQKLDENKLKQNAAAINLFKKNDQDYQANVVPVLKNLKDFLINFRDKWHFFCEKNKNIFNFEEQTDLNYLNELLNKTLKHSIFKMKFSEAHLELINTFIHPDQFQDNSNVITLMAKFYGQENAELFSNPNQFYQLLKSSGQNKNVLKLFSKFWIDTVEDVALTNAVIAATTIAALKNNYLNKDILFALSKYLNRKDAFNLILVKKSASKAANDAAMNFFAEKNKQRNVLENKAEIKIQNK